MTKISAVIITLNEEKNIERCVLAAQKVADEVIILDSNSTDNTVELANQLNCVVVQQVWLGYSAQKNKANALAKHDFILSLDADEELDQTLINAILEEKSKGLTCAYSFNRLTNYCGHWIHHSGWYPDKKTRIFPKEGTQWEGEFVHETLKLPNGCTTVHLDGDLNHYSYNSYDEHRKRAEGYVKLSAESLFERGKQVGLFKPYLSGIAKFISMYLFNLGFLDGKMGVMIAWISAEASVKKYLILKQMNKDRK
ncbi:MAG: glycosyl transferase [Crocinitomicaceae bacterium]|nr:glycosyl transferase [Crocinitomicaceae bacterium]|tara:strand:- start:6163 stop:6921 length:759 start_codon:yes stop_codon:yes gene_type:complete